MSSQWSTTDNEEINYALYQSSGLSNLINWKLDIYIIISWQRRGSVRQQTVPKRGAAAGNERYWSVTLCAPSQLSGDAIGAVSALPVYILAVSCNISLRLYRERRWLMTDCLALSVDARKCRILSPINLADDTAIDVETHRPRPTHSISCPL